MASPPAWRILGSFLGAGPARVLRRLGSPFPPGRRAAGAALGSPATRVVAIAAIVLGTPLIACAGEKAEAQRMAQVWFLGELGRIGYVRQADGVYATPPKPVSDPLLGEALETQIRRIAVTGVREAVLTEDDRANDVRWRGQVSLSYELREQYHKDGRPRGWSEWTKETSLLGLEHRGGQWFVTRIR